MNASPTRYSLPLVVELGLEAVERRDHLGARRGGRLVGGDPEAQLDVGGAEAAPDRPRGRVVAQRPRAASRRRAPPSARGRCAARARRAAGSAGRAARRTSPRARAPGGARPGPRGRAAAPASARSSAAMIAVESPMLRPSRRSTGKVLCAPRVSQSAIGDVRAGDRRPALVLDSPCGRAPSGPSRCSARRGCARGAASIAHSTSISESCRETSVGRRQRPVAGPDRAHPAAGREHQPAGLDVVGAHVRRPRPAADHLGDVVVAAQPQLGVVVEDLALASGCRGRRGKRASSRRQVSPPLPPRLDLAHGDVVAGEQERAR